MIRYLHEHSEPGLAYLYEIEGGRYLFLAHRSPRGRPADFVAPAVEELAVLRRFLVAQGWLRQEAAAPVLRLGNHWDRPKTGAQIVDTLSARFIFGVQHTTHPVSFAELPTAAQTAEPDQLRRVLFVFAVGQAAAARQADRPAQFHILPLELRGTATALVNSTTPELCADLPWPLVGPHPTQPKNGHWSWAPAPPPPQAGYPHLRALFPHQQFDPISFFYLHAYLFGCFHTCFLHTAVPILVVDSWEQAMGKSEVAAAIANLLHGAPTPCLSPSRRPTSEPGEALAAHYGAGHHIALLDNLDAAVDWNHPWLTSILSERGGSARRLYDRDTSNFRARMAILTFVFGRATLHEDLVSRCWRVQLHGDASRYAQAPPPYYSKDYALEHRDALISECYWAVARTADNARRLQTSSRASRFLAVGAAAYREVFGELPSLENEAAHRAMLSTHALQLFVKNRIPFRRKPAKTDPLPPTADCSRLVGGTALGFRVVEGQKLEPCQ